MSVLIRTDFCCYDMYDNLIGPDKDGCELHFEYDPISRGFSIDYKEECGGGMQTIFFCPWCGSKLPKELLSEYEEEISKELGFSFADSDIVGSDDPRIPEEFRTDQWWKKRGL